MYEAVGGEAGFMALVQAHHQRCVEDEELNHMFGREGDPEHLQHLAAYLAEVFGGPPLYSQTHGGHSFMLNLHAHHGMTDDLGSRFVACWVQAADDAGLPEDPELRSTLRAYMERAVAEVYLYNAPDSTVAAELPMPHWSWDGLQHG